MTPGSKTPALVELANAISVADDGWAQLAPYGEFPAAVMFPDGTVRTGTQRIDATSAQAVAAGVRSFTGRAKRFFRSIPIFHGHPDAPAVANAYPDAEPKGTLADIQAREDGLWVRLALNEAGATLVNSGEPLGLSAHVDASISEVRPDGSPVTVWTFLRSIGLTHKTRLPVALINSLSASETNMNPPANIPISTVVALLSTAGVTMANDATPEVAQAKLAERLRLANSLEGQVTALTSERDNLKTRAEAAEARATALDTDRRVTLLNSRVADGAIAEADRAVWDGRLKANWEAESKTLAAVKAGTAVATQTRLANAADRQSGAASGADGDQLIARIEEIRKANPKLTFQEAYMQAATTGAR